MSHFAKRTDAVFHFSEETTPLGTGGAVRHATPLVASDPFLLLNGDSFCRVDFSALLAFHREKRAPVSMVVAESRGRSDVGNIELAADGRITSFREKTAPVAGGRALINAGIYVIPRDLPLSWRAPDPMSLERDVFPSLATAGNCFGYVVDTEVIDIGTPERYADAQHKLGAG